MFESCFNTDGIGWKKLRKMRRDIFGGKCPYTDQSCLSFDCEHCNVEEYESITKDKDFVFCVECTKVHECKKCKREQIDGCNNGILFFDPKSSGSEDK